MERLEKVLHTERPKTFEHCISWALQCFNKWFCDDIEQILCEYSADYIDASTGKTFWSGKRQLPHALKFDANKVRIPLTNNKNKK